MNSKRKEQIYTLLKGIETGDPNSVKVVNESKYIQHNPQTLEGSEGLAELFKRLSKTSPRVNIVRVFADGEYVFAHTEYDFSNSNIGFEIFRFENDHAVEHWDNIQHRLGPNLSGHSMIDGPKEATDLELTEANRSLVHSYVNNILINCHLDNLGNYLSNGEIIEHSPERTDGLSALRETLEEKFDNDLTLKYEHNHRILAEGNFVLSVSEGRVHGNHSAFFDLFRVSMGKIVEHWDTIETIPSRAD
jgi:predicted SnoaL-like aldol condensation-catalyzing enzyme